MAASAPATPLEEALEAWEGTRRGLLEEARSIGADAYGWRPAPNSRSVAETLRHVLESGLMAVGELTRTDGDFTRAPFRELVREHAGDLPGSLAPRELCDHLERALEAGVEAFREVGEDHMTGPIRRFDGAWGTRLAWLHHHVEHESYHRGQLALFVRMLGGTPALTRRIHGE